MLSRVASLTYWTARYLERAENTARLLNVNNQLVLDLQSRQAADAPRAWEPLVYVCGGDSLFRKRHGTDVTERTVVDFVLFDRQNPSSVFSCVATARENARCIRDQLASEVWEELNSFFLRLKDDDYERYAQLGSAEYLHFLKSNIHRFYGVADSMIPRTQMWWFFELGRFLERADSTSRILDVKYFMLLPANTRVGSALDMVQWASVLRSCSAFEAFRQSRRGQLSLERVVDYLLRDTVFPRSVLFSVNAIHRALTCITADAPHLADNAAVRLVTALREHLENCDTPHIITRGLHEYLDDLQVRTGDIHDAIQDVFIHYSTDHARVLA
jgi:Uncharacterized protein conserved in bacteria